jgi:hypothetical protein
MGIHNRPFGLFAARIFGTVSANLLNTDVGGSRLKLLFFFDQPRVQDLILRISSEIFHSSAI